MSKTRKLLYIFRGKLEMEDVGEFDVTARARQLQGCTRSTIYTIADLNYLLQYGPNYWIAAVNPPDEIKLAAMLVN